MLSSSVTVLQHYRITVGRWLAANLVTLSAEIERFMIPSRTTEALARWKSEGKRLGRPKGSLARQTKLTGKEDLIREYLEKGISQTVIAKLLDVNRLTLRHFIASRKLSYVT
ncbi:MAG: hypothetical protein JO249_12170 [Acidobacteria bacterium]|nr:hypothetical protein [Acidobacteriota bacterium]